MKPAKQHKVVLARKQVNILLKSSKTKQIQRDEKCVCVACNEQVGKHSFTMDQSNLK